MSSLLRTKRDKSRIQIREGKMKKIFLMLALGCGIAHAQCARFPAAESSAYDSELKSVNLPWRTDLPSSIGSNQFAWEGKKFETDWRAYMQAFLSEIKTAGVQISDRRLHMNASAEWWISPWMDYGTSGREKLNGLTAERGPKDGDLSPTSKAGAQTWAVGWYNRPGAFAIGQIFKDPCSPSIPSGWAFPNQSASFKFLFSDADVSQVAYLEGAPEIDAFINPANVQVGPIKNRVPRSMRLIQVDIAIRDPAAKETGWVMGTFVWRKPAAGFKGDWLYDNLVPVGLMWGNDPGIQNDQWNGFAAVKQSHLNVDLAGTLWQASGQTWKERPYPGFQGRLNGPADNPRSSCLSCHAAAQWRRDQPIVGSPNLDASLTSELIRAHVLKYFGNTPAGSRHAGSSVGTSLDYSLQLEAGIDRLCRACNDEKLTGITPAICKVPTVQPTDSKASYVDRATCDRNPVSSFFMKLLAPSASVEPLPRQ
jgi:hypothetical protein